MPARESDVTAESHPLGYAVGKAAATQTSKTCVCFSARLHLHMCVCVCARTGTGVRFLWLECSVTISRILLQYVQDGDI